MNALLLSMASVVAAVNRASRSLRSRGHATHARTRITLASLALVAGSLPASADESRRFVITPIECAAYAPLPEDDTPDWDRWLSFAACSQDASLGEVDDADQLPALVEDMQTALMPTLELYFDAVKHGPGPVRIRAGFQMGMSQVELITRARASINARDLWTSPDAAARFEQLHAELEPLLHQSVLLAWTLFDAIDRIVMEDPELAPDAVTRGMVRRARELASELGGRWSFPTIEQPPLIATPR